MRIADASFVILDTETTGLRAATDRLIEVAAVKVHRGEVVERFSQLIDPGCAVPGRITRITGITTAMVFGKPRAAEVLPWLVDFIGESVLVAHNLPFDARFLDAELQRCGIGRWSGRSVCTLRLARRLLRGLHSKGLASVADFYGISIHGRHRALGDAEATAQIFLRFLNQLEHEYGIADVDELIGFQHRSYRRLSASTGQLDRIREEILPKVPSVPGVYFMKDARGEIIYIGKALSLSARVRSYFNAVEAHPDRLRRLVYEVRDIGWKETHSELGALLLESRLIKQHQPTFNRAQRSYRARPFLKIETDHPFPRLSISSVALPDGAEYYGPFASRGEAEFLKEVIDEHFGLRECDDKTFARHTSCVLASMGRCPHQPCGRETANLYDEELNRVRRFLEGKDRSVLTAMHHSMKAAAAELEFERASRFRDGIRRLETLLDRRGGLAPSLARQNGILLWRRPDGEHVAIVISHGRLVEEQMIEGEKPTWGELRRLIDAARRFDAGERYWKEEADEVRLIQQWIHRNRTALDVIELDEWTDDGALTRIEMAQFDGEAKIPHAPAINS